MGDERLAVILWREFTKGSSLWLSDGAADCLLVNWESFPSVAKTYRAQDTPPVAHYCSAALPDLRVRVDVAVSRAQRAAVLWVPDGGGDECRIEWARVGAGWAVGERHAGNVTRPSS